MPNSCSAVFPQTADLQVLPRKKSPPETCPVLLSLDVHLKLLPNSPFSPSCHPHHIGFDRISEVLIDIGLSINTPSFILPKSLCS